MELKVIPKNGVTVIFCYGDEIGIELRSKLGYQEPLTLVGIGKRGDTRERCFQWVEDPFYIRVMRNQFELCLPKSSTKDRAA